jgi:hypothetical protein
LCCPSDIFISYPIILCQPKHPPQHFHFFYFIFIFLCFWMGHVYSIQHGWSYESFVCSWFNPCPDSFVTQNSHRSYAFSFSNLTGFYVLFHNDDCSYPSMSVVSVVTEGWGISQLLQGPSKRFRQWVLSVSLDYWTGGGHHVAPGCILGRERESWLWFLPGSLL